MGKRIIQQARGRGGSRYRSPSHRFLGKPRYPREGKIKVIDIVHDPGHNTPLAEVEYDKGREYIFAAEGIKVGDVFEVGKDIRIGSIAKIGLIPKGSPVFAIETTPGSGPKLCCSPGTHATIISSEEGKVVLQLPSKEFKTFNQNCFATIGIPAGSGRKDKPFLKAGKKYYAMKARNKLWPRTSAVAMNAVDHPFGGSTKPGVPKSVNRNASPGAKVGDLASRRTGRKKR